MIEKKIHYCWFGKGEKSELIVNCIKSWKTALPDYEIIEWNENNFNINISKYTKEAYFAGKYAFVSDYARFYILFHNGGIYLDVDVEVIKPLDKFLENKAFMGFETREFVAPGLIIGSEKGNNLIKKILDVYSNKNFILENGSYNLKTVVQYTTEILLEYGLKLDNSYQDLGEIIIYPKTYFCPLTNNSKKSDFTEDTHTIHYYAATWLTDKQKRRNNSLYWKCLKPILKFLKPKIIKLFGEQLFQKLRKR